MDLTFEQLPKAISQLFDKLNNIEKLLEERKESIVLNEDALLTIEEAASFTHLSKLTLYGLVSRAEIPFMKKGKRLYFSKDELTQWIKSGRKRTNAEISLANSTLTIKKSKTR